jgi:hypothetical protein
MYAALAAVPGRVRSEGNRKEKSNPDFFLDPRKLAKIELGTLPPSIILPPRSLAFPAPSRFPLRGRPVGCARSRASRCGGRGTAARRLRTSLVPADCRVYRDRRQLLRRRRSERDMRTAGGETYPISISVSSGTTPNETAEGPPRPAGGARTR